MTGYVHDMSQGGLRVITARALTNSALVRCEISIGDDPVHISTLTQVRWSQPEKLGSDHFISGLRFLI